MSTSPPSRTTRRVTAGVVLGAAAALVLATLLGGVDDGQRDLALRGAARTPSSTPTPTPEPFEAPVGTCLTWTEDDASDARQVPCSQPHLFEITGTVYLGAAFGPNAPYPSPSEWRELIDRRCSSAAQDYLDGKFDPFGRYSVGAVKPSRQAWRAGERELRCGLQAVGSSGAVYPTTGTVAQAGQADVHEPGTCLGLDGKGIGGPVDCSQPHAVEVVAVVDLGKAFEGADYPSEDKQDEFLADKCRKLAAEYAGGPEVVQNKGLTVFWQTLRKRSWQAGTRKVECRLGAALPDESGFAPIIGSVKGEVTIKDEPAPEDPMTQGPAPMPLPTPTPPPSSSPPSPSPSASPDS